MDWFLQRLEQADPTLDYFDLRDHPNDFKTLLDLKILKYARKLDAVPCDLCDEDHLAPVFTNKNGELVISCAGSRRAVNPDEVKIWTVNRDVAIKKVRSRNPIIDKAIFKQTAFASNKDTDDKCWLVKKEGTYYFNGNLVYIKSKNAQYIRILDIVYTLNPHGGDVTYSKIIQLGSERGIKLKKKTIQQALTGSTANLFQYVETIKRMPAYGIPLFEAKQNGKELVFNNKKV